MIFKRVLSESYPMNTNMIGFRWFSKNTCIFVLWMTVASALEGLKVRLTYRINGLDWSCGCTGWTDTSSVLGAHSELVVATFLQVGDCVLHGVYLQVLRDTRPLEALLVLLFHVVVCDGTAAIFLRWWPLQADLGGADRGDLQVLWRAWGIYQNKRERSELITFTTINAKTQMENLDYPVC